MTTSSFKLSAIVSTYASERYITGCLEDLTSQSLYKRGGLEILVIDSASPQSEGAIVRDFQARFPNIVYHRTAARETLYGAWNTGVRIAQGELLTNANTDDRHRADAFEQLCGLLDRNPQIDLAYSDCFRTNTANERFESYTGATRYHYKPFFAPDVVLHFQFGPQPVWRKSVHQRCGLFDPQFRAAGDWEFNFRFNLAGCRALHLAEPLGLFLDHPQSISQSDSASAKEQAQLRNHYVNVENLTRFYRSEGWTLDTPREMARMLNDFALRTAFFTLPWEPGKEYCDISLAVPLLAKALEILPNHPALINNLGAILARSGRSGDALQVLSSSSQLIGSSYTQDNLASISAGRLDQLKFHQEIN